MNIYWSHAYVDHSTAHLPTGSELPAPLSGGGTRRFSLVTSPGEGGKDGAGNKLCDNQQKRALSLDERNLSWHVI